MKIAITLSGLALLIGGCAHEPERPAVSTTSTTSAALTRQAEPTQLPQADAQPKEPAHILAVFPDTTPAPTYVPATDKIEVAKQEPIEDWSGRYPDASTQLVDWIKAHPATAERVAAFDARHPIRMSSLVDWAVTHKYESVEAFLYGRAGWDELQGILHDDPSAMAELVDWMRRSPHAAEELASHQESIGWSRTHLAKVTPKRR